MIVGSNTGKPCLVQGFLLLFGAVSLLARCTSRAREKAAIEPDTSRIRISLRRRLRRVCQ